MRKGFGKRLKLARASTEQKQVTLTRSVGVNPSVWNRWEKERVRPNARQLVLIHEALSISLDWLILGIDVGSLQHQRLFLLLMRLPDREVVKWIEMLEVRFSGRGN